MKKFIYKNLLLVHIIIAIIVILTTALLILTFSTNSYNNGYSDGLKDSNTIINDNSIDNNTTDLTIKDDSSNDLDKKEFKVEYIYNSPIEFNTALKNSSVAPLTFNPYSTIGKINRFAYEYIHFYDENNVLEDEPMIDYLTAEVNYLNKQYTVEQGKSPTGGSEPICKEKYIVNVKDIGDIDVCTYYDNEELTIAQFTFDNTNNTNVYSFYLKFGLEFNKVEIENIIKSLELVIR